MGFLARRKLGDFAGSFDAACSGTHQFARPRVNRSTYTQSEVDMRTIHFLLISGFLAATPALGAARTVCVGSSAELSAALANLSTAPGNSDNDDIRIRTGTYIAPIAGWVGTASGSHDLSIRGGYTDVNCLARTQDAALTVLDGGNAAGVLKINAFFSHTATIEVSGLTFQNGNGSAEFEFATGGLKISDPGPISNGSILVEGNIFRDNVATNAEGSRAAGGLLAATDGQSLIVRNNLFVGNRAPVIAAAYVFSNNQVNVSNNTFTGNQATDTTAPQRVVMDYFTLTNLALSNNIFWGNAVGAGAFDLNFSGQTRRATLVNNDIQAWAGTPFASTGALSVAPGFISETNFRLSPDSALINAGVINPPGGLAAVDLDGAPRIDASAVDLGAYETSGRIFGNGFEQP